MPTPPSEGVVSRRQRSPVGAATTRRREARPERRPDDHEATGRAAIAASAFTPENGTEALLSPCEQDPPYTRPRRDGLRRPLPLPRALREPLPPRPAGEVQGLVRSGVAWSLANPVLLMGVYLLVFSVLWKARADRPLLALPALRARAVDLLRDLAAVASRSLLDNANLIRKMRFPRQLVPLSIVATQLVALRGDAASCCSSLNFVAAAARARDRVARDPARRADRLLVARARARRRVARTSLFRDVEHLVAALLLPWFFLTPVLYTLGTLGAAGRIRRSSTCSTGATSLTPPIERDPRPALLRAAARAGRRALPRRRGGRLARARRVGLQPRRRPDRSRSLITIRPS